MSEKWIITLAHDAADRYCTWLGLSPFMWGDTWELEAGMYRPLGYTLFRAVLTNLSSKTFFWTLGAMFASPTSGFPSLHPRGNQDLIGPRPVLKVADGQHRKFFRGVNSPNNLTYSLTGSLLPRCIPSTTIAICRSQPSTDIHGRTLMGGE